MQYEKIKRAIKSNQITLLGIGICVLLLVIESAIHAFVFQRGGFISQLYPSSPHELWMRAIIVGGLLFFITYVQLVIKKRRKAEEIIKKAHDELEQRVLDRTRELEKINERMGKEIKEHEQVKRELRLSKEKYRMLVETMNDGLALYDKNNLNIYANDKFCQMLGYSVDAIIGRPARDFLDDDNQKILKEQILERKKGKRKPYELTWIRRDGENISTIISPTPVLDCDGRYSGSLIVITDITEINHAKKMLQESEAFTRTILDNLPIGIAVNSVDPIVKFEYMNDNFPRFYRTTREALADPDAFWNAVYEEPEFREKIKKKVLDDCATGNPKRMCWVDVPITRKGRETAFITARNIPVPDKHLTISTVWDVTERKQAEEALMVSEKKLRQSQKIEAVGTLAGGIAHDFNNILASVLGYTEVAIDKLKSADHNVLDDLTTVYQAGHRAKDLVHQILQFSRQTKADFKPVDIRLIVKEALKLFRISLPETIEVKQNIQMVTDNIMADGSQIHQVVMNLCTNAFHAMSPKGGVLTVQLFKKEIENSVICHGNQISPGNYTVLTIGDTGCGMDSETLQRIFEPYFTTKAHREGTGLGLAVSCGIVRNHGGGICVESTPGVGSVFTLYFPTTGPQTQKEISNLPPIEGGHERILFIDDEPFFVDLGAKILSGLGYEVIKADDGLKALEIFTCQPDRFDLVISDQTMPKMTGLELSRKLHTLRPKTPIIICTGFSEVINGKTAQQIGISHILYKPTTKRDLAFAVREVLDDSKSKIENGVG